MAHRNAHARLAFDGLWEPEAVVGDEAGAAELHRVLTGGGMRMHNAPITAPKRLVAHAEGMAAALDWLQGPFVQQSNAYWAEKGRPARMKLRIAYYVTSERPDGEAPVTLYRLWGPLETVSKDQLQAALERAPADFTRLYEEQQVARDSGSALSELVGVALFLTPSQNPARMDEKSTSASVVDTDTESDSSDSYSDTEDGSESDGDSDSEESDDSRSEEDEEEDEDEDEAKKKSADPKAAAGGTGTLRAATAASVPSTSHGATDRAEELLRCGGVFRVVNSDPWCVARAAVTSLLYFAHTDLVNGTPPSRAERSGQVRVSKTLVDAVLPAVLEGTHPWLSFVGLTEAGADPEDLSKFEAQSHPRLAFQGFQIDGCFGLVHRSPRLLDPEQRKLVTHVISFGFRDGHCDVVRSVARCLNAGSGRNGRRREACPLCLKTVSQGSGALATHFAKGCRAADGPRVPRLGQNLKFFGPRERPIQIPAPLLAAIGDTHTISEAGVLQLTTLSAAFLQRTPEGPCSWQPDPAQPTTRCAHDGSGERAMVDAFVTAMVEAVPHLVALQAQSVDMDPEARDRCIAALTLESPCVLCGDELKGPPRHSGILLAQLQAKRAGAGGDLGSEDEGEESEESEDDNEVAALSAALSSLSVTPVSAACPTCTAACSCVPIDELLKARAKVKGTKPVKLASAQSTWRNGETQKRLAERTAQAQQEAGRDITTLEELKRSVHVHHDHNTGGVIGACHPGACNMHATVTANDLLVVASPLVLHALKRSVARHPYFVCGRCTCEECSADGEGTKHRAPSFSFRDGADGHVAHVSLEIPNGFVWDAWHKRWYASEEDAEGAGARLSSAHAAAFAKGQGGAAWTPRKIALYYKLRFVVQEAFCAFEQGAEGSAAAAAVSRVRRLLDYSDAMFKLTGIEPVLCASNAAFSLKAALKLDALKGPARCPSAFVELDMLQFIKRSIHGGLIIPGQRKICRANNPCIEGFEASKPTTWIIGLDINKAYAAVMRDAWLPYDCGDAFWLPKILARPLSEQCKWIEEFAEDKGFSAFIECDVLYPVEFHSKASVWPFLQEKRPVFDSELGDIQRGIFSLAAQSQPKTICDLYPKKRIVLHIAKLQLLLREFGPGALTAVHMILVIPSKRWLRPFVQAFEPALFAAVAAGDKSAVAAIKACFVSAAGALNHNVEAYTKQRAYLSAKFNACRVKKDGSRGMSLNAIYADKATFRGAEVLGSFTLVETAQQRPLLAELTAAYAAILSECSVLLSRRVYDIMRLFPDAVQSLYSDTDSAYLLVQSEFDPMVRICCECPWFDAGKQCSGFWERYCTANGPDEASCRQLRAAEERGSIGRLSDCGEGHVFESFVTSAPKSYALTGGKPVLRGAARNIAGASAADLERGLLGQAPAVLGRTTMRTTDGRLTLRVGTVSVGRFAARNCLVGTDGEACPLGDRSERGRALVLAATCGCNSAEPCCARC